ncbi:DUF7638 domain-containing protein [Paenibacillus dendritiformis]|uniref:DUF7638 domain-containing protein n=1 Tax=Paenibacillus dendritiformis TaxID=130049 RepID=UPI00387E1E57
MQKIRRTKVIEGTVVPGIINNGGHYFYIDVDVYEDGMVNCWELVDLRGLRDKINSNWLSPCIPSGEHLSVHGLGSYTVESANWFFNKDSYFQHIESKLKALNPEWENIYTITPRQKKLCEERRIAHSPKATNFYVAQELFYDTIEGNGFSIFMKEENKNYLVNLVIYKNGVVVRYDSSHERTYQAEEVKALFEDGTFFTSFEAPTAVMIPDLGEVGFSRSVYSTKIEDKYTELLDMQKKLRGEKSSLEACREAYFMYLEYPSEFTRANLKEKYELVPEHERMFLGDMDTKDWDYRRIIYRPNEKREV